MSYGHANCRDCGRPTNYYPEVGEDESGILCDLCKWRNCDHEWAWEHARMLCRKCGWERPSTETMEYAQERIAALEDEVERVNRIVVSQSQQLGNTRSQREHELIEALDSTQADADTQFKLRAQAEAEVQRLRVAEAEAMNILEGTELKLEQAEAEVALRDRMLHAIWLGHKKWKVPTADTEDEWLADLRARAEKEAER